MSHTDKGEISSGGKIWVATQKNGASALGL